MSRIPRSQEQVFGPSGRRLLYEQTQQASEFAQHPDGQVAMVLLEVAVGPGKAHLTENVLQAVTSKLSSLLNRRLRSIDTLVRTADTEIAVLLAQSHLGVAAAFSERLKQPIDQALSEMDLASDVVVCMGLAANPPDCSWRADELIELADYRMRTARQRAWGSAEREWAVEVDGDSVPQEWSDAEEWPATTEMTINQAL